MSWIGLVSFPVWSVDEGENPLVFLVDDEEYFYGRQNDLTEQPNTHTRKIATTGLGAGPTPAVRKKQKNTTLPSKPENRRSAHPKAQKIVGCFRIRCPFSTLLVATITLQNEDTSPLKDTAIVAESCNCIGLLFELVFVAF